MTEPSNTRYDLDAALSGRSAIDANWSRRKKLLVAGGASLAAVAAATAGMWWAIASRPPALPKTAQEAVTVLASDRFDRLDAERQRQYEAEAMRLFGQLSDEERLAMMRDEANRDAMRRMMRQRFDEITRRFARGEAPDFPAPVRRPRTDDGEAPERPRLNPEDISPEDRERFRERMRERLNEQIAEQAQSGNAQESGLRAEMMKRMGRRGPGRGGAGGRR